MATAPASISWRARDRREMAPGWQRAAPRYHCPVGLSWRGGAGPARPQRGLPGWAPMVLITAIAHDRDAHLSSSLIWATTYPNIRKLRKE
jgi:hypothetical protein